MDSTNVEVYLVILLLEAITGLFSSFSMIACLSLKKFRTKNKTTYSKILIPLNLSNICYTFFLSINFFFSFLWPQPLKISFVYYTISYMTLYSITSSLWLSGGLCVFYFMKIMPSQSGVLKTLKSRIGAVVWWLAIMAEVVSLGGSFLSILTTDIQINQRNSSLRMSGGTQETNTQNYFTFMDIVLILNFLPFLVIMMTTIGCAWFLRMYNFQIKKNLETSRNTSVRNYQVAIRNMIGLLVLYGLSFICIIIFTLNVFFCPSVGYWICVIFLFSFPSVLSALLIYTNPKLKESLKQMFIL